LILAQLKVQRVKEKMRDTTEASQEAYMKMIIMNLSAVKQTALTDHQPH
jgi:hypothetical protein